MAIAAIFTTAATLLFYTGMSVSGEITVNPFTADELNKHLHTHEPGPWRALSTNENVCEQICITCGEEIHSHATTGLWSPFSTGGNGCIRSRTCTTSGCGRVMTNTHAINQNIPAATCTDARICRASGCGRTLNAALGHLYTGKFVYIGTDLGARVSMHAAGYSCTRCGAVGSGTPPNAPTDPHDWCMFNGSLPSSTCVGYFARGWIFHPTTGNRAWYVSTTRGGCGITRSGAREAEVSMGRFANGTTNELNDTHIYWFHWDYSTW